MRKLAPTLVDVGSRVEAVSPILSCSHRILATEYRINPITKGSESSTPQTIVRASRPDLSQCLLSETTLLTLPHLAKLRHEIIPVTGARQLTVYVIFRLQRFFIVTLVSMH